MGGFHSLIQFGCTCQMNFRSAVAVNEKVSWTLSDSTGSKRRDERQERKKKRPRNRKPYTLTFPPKPVAYLRIFKIDGHHINLRQKSDEDDFSVSHKWRNFDTNLRLQLPRGKKTKNKKKKESRATTRYPCKITNSLGFTYLPRQIDKVQAPWTLENENSRR